MSPEAVAMALGGITIVGLLSFSIRNSRTAAKQATRPLHGPPPAAKSHETSTPIERAIKEDNFKLVGDLIGGSARINEPVETSDGPMSPLFLAVREGAVRTSRYLLAMGADAEAEFNGVTCRSLALRPESLQCLGVFFGAGLAPRGEELLAYAGSGVPSVVPETELDGELRDLFADVQAILKTGSLPDQGAICRAIREGKAFQAMTAQARNAMVTANRNITNSSVRNPSLKAKAHRVIAEIEEGIRSHSDMSAWVVFFAANLMLNNPDKISDIVVRYFNPFRHNLGILDQQSRSASIALAEWFGPICNLPEDHQAIVKACRFTIMRYPIREVLEHSSRPSARPTRPPGLDFEAATADALIMAGYEVQLTPTTGDQGADLIARKNGLSYAIQCKDFASATGNAAVQQAAAGKAFYSTDYAVVCAPMGYTKSARELAARNSVILVTPELVGNIDVLAKLVG